MISKRERHIPEGRGSVEKEGKGKVWKETGGRGRTSKGECEGEGRKEGAGEGLGGAEA